MSTPRGGGASGCRCEQDECVRTGLRLILDGHPDIDVAGEAVDGFDALHEAAQLQPDVVMMDIRMPRCDGLEATRQLIERFPDTKVVILTTFDLDENVYEALRAGASGFLLKDVPSHQLIDAIRAAAAGNALLAPSITRRLIAVHPHHAARPSDSPRRTHAGWCHRSAQRGGPEPRRPIRRPPSGMVIVIGVRPYAPTATPRECGPRRIGQGRAGAAR